MESRIEELKAKYWEGKTSVDEEKELKKYFQQNPTLNTEGQYFRRLDKMEKVKLEQTIFSHPGKKANRTWWVAAASIVIGILVAMIAVQDARTHDPYLIDDPEEALMITRKALMLLSVSINEGQDYSSKIKNINEAQEVLTQ